MQRKCICIVHLRCEDVIDMPCHASGPDTLCDIALFSECMHACSAALPVDTCPLCPLCAVWHAPHVTEMMVMKCINVPVITLIPSLSPSIVQSLKELSAGPE